MTKRRSQSQKGESTQKGFMDSKSVTPNMLYWNHFSFSCDSLISDGWCHKSGTLSTLVFFLVPLQYQALPITSWSKGSNGLTWTCTFSFLETRSLFIVEITSFSLMSSSPCLFLAPSSTLSANHHHHIQGKVPFPHHSWDNWRRYIKRFFIHPQRRILNTSPEGIHVGMKEHLHEGDE